MPTYFDRPQRPFRVGAICTDCPKIKWQGKNPNDFNSAHSATPANIERPQRPSAPIPSGRYNSSIITAGYSGCHFYSAHQEWAPKKANDFNMFHSAHSAPPKGGDKEMGAIRCAPFLSPITPLGPPKIYPLSGEV